MMSEDSLWILQHKQTPVATCSYNAQIKEAVQIGGVYTPPELRNQGFAKAVVATSLKAAFDSGTELAFLFTGQQNIPAQRAYQAIGFTPVGEYQICCFCSDNHFEWKGNT